MYICDPALVAARLIASDVKLRSLAQEEPGRQNKVAKLAWELRERESSSHNGRANSYCIADLTSSEGESQLAAE